MRIRIVILSVLSFFVSCSVNPDYLQRVMEYQNHKNQQDMDFVLGMFTEDASLIFGSLGSLAGIEQVRAIHEYDVAINTKLRFDDCKAVGRTVSCRTTEMNDWLSLADIVSITYEESRFVFTPDGSIQSITATMSSKSGEVLGAALVQFDTWARLNQAEEYSALFLQDGRFSYSYENGKRVLSLLRQWRPD